MKGIIQNDKHIVNAILVGLLQVSIQVFMYNIAYIL